MTTYTYAPDVPKAIENGTADLLIDVFAPINDTDALRPIIIFAHGVEVSEQITLFKNGAKTDLLYAAMFVRASIIEVQQKYQVNLLSNSRILHSRICRRRFDGLERTAPCLVLTQTK